MSTGRKWLFPLLLAGVFFLCATLIFWRKHLAMSETIYTVGVPSHWGTIVPPLQHTLIGDAVIAYQFNPLVKTEDKGLVVPAAARSWELSQDRRILRFKINTGLRFSDGSYLQAADFKRSWEDGLKLEAKSSNSSLADGLSNLKGFHDFKNTGEISGVRVLSADTLELEFEKPVRRTLQRFTGGRFSVYKMVGGVPIGTGPYVITEAGQVLTLEANPYYAGQAPALKHVKIINVPAKVALEKLQSGEIDAYLIAEMALMPGCDEGKLAPISCSSGQEGMHLIINLNGLPGRLFADHGHRAAFQALVWNNIGQAKEAFNARGFESDPQSFLQFQSGRIHDDEVQAAIRAGEPHIKRFLKATEKTPLFLAAGPLGWEWLADILRKNGVKLSTATRFDFPPKEFWEMYYKTFTPDIMPMGASVSDGDPDGLYHLLGRHGAIFSPIAARKAVCDGMETGRELLDLTKLGAHYEAVSRDILKEIPYVHLGYLNRRVAYNSDRLHLKESFVGRHNLSILDFSPR